MRQRSSLWRDNGLSITLAILFVVFLVAQTVTGWTVENDERVQHQRAVISLSDYVLSGAFVEATAENWESEFLQMFAYVLLTVSLYQRGSAESKDPDKVEDVDRAPDPSKKDAPAAVRRQGLALWLYERSLGIAFFSLFAISFALHAMGGAAAFNEEARMHNEPVLSTFGYLCSAQFWFESFQNWQSEFLAIGSMVVLTVWLRQRGSPESKPVDAAHDETG